MTSHRPWTEAEDLCLKRLLPTTSCAEIGERLGRTTNAVYCRASALGLGRPVGETNKLRAVLRGGGVVEATRVDSEGLQIAIDVLMGLARRPVEDGHEHPWERGRTTW